MATYEVKVDLPGDIQQFFETLNEQAAAEFSAGQSKVKLTFEADDEWELAHMVKEAEDRVRSNMYLDFSIGRPVKVEDDTDAQAGN